MTIAITVVSVPDTAAVLRRELRRHWPTVAFTVTRAAERGARAQWLDIAWTDGPTAHAVDTIARRYRQGLDYAPGPDPHEEETGGRVVVYAVNEIDYRRSLSVTAHESAVRLLETRAGVAVPRLPGGGVDWTTAAATIVDRPVVLDGRVIGHALWFRRPEGYSATVSDLVHRVAADTDHTAGTRNTAAVRVIGQGRVS